ncbi:MAG: hypothetical protein P8P91_06970 [Pseudomonadales bacterium]|nr:hypothetical protein [Pseudomonadales bacterium]
MLRQQFTTNFVAVPIIAGAIIGLVNIWRSSYVMGFYGGTQSACWQSLA